MVKFGVHGVKTPLDEKDRIVKPIATDDLDTGPAGGGLDELSQAVRNGRLVALLKGKGLDRSTVDELLRPESLLALKGMLTDHLFGNEER